MKKNYLILLTFVAVIIACNKEIMTNEDIQVVSFAKAEKLTGNELKVMTSSMSNDPLFQDYLVALIDIQKTQEIQISKIKKEDAGKWKNAAKPKNEAEYIAIANSVGYSNPELILSKYKEASGKLAKLYKKYPNFSNSLTDEEKKAYFKNATLKFYAK